MYYVPANKNYLEAQFCIGMDYLEGNGIKEDHDQALEWFYKAASEDYAPAQDAIGCMYSYGFGVEQDYSRAFDWCLKAANQGYDQAQNNIAYLYKEGLGVPQDSIKAAEWYKKAAEQGQAEAQYQLADMYRKGTGVTRYFTEAIKWLEMASKQNHVDAQYELGNFYEEGIGVNRDKDKAYHWYSRAADLGHSKAKICLHKYYDKSKLNNQSSAGVVEEIDSNINQLKPETDLLIPFKAFFDNYFRDETKRMPQNTGGGVWFFESMSSEEINKFSDKAFDIKQKTDYKAVILNADFIIDTTITKNYGAGLFLHIYENSYILHLKNSAEDWKVITEINKAKYYQADKILSVNGYDISLTNDNARFYAERLADCINAYLDQNKVEVVEEKDVYDSELVTNALDDIEGRLAEIKAKMQSLQEELAA